MTPEEWARQVLTDLGDPHEYEGYVSVEVGRSTLLGRIMVALRAAVAEEREACANVAEKSMPFIVEFDPRDHCACPEEIAAAIRART